MGIKKRIATGALAGTAVFGAVFGLAAGLNVKTSQLGSGSETVTSCDATVTTSYLGGAGFVDKVKVSDIANACDGAQMYIKVTGPQQPVTPPPVVVDIAELADNDTWIDVDLGTEVDPAEITGVTVTFLGGETVDLQQ
ncbi:MAG TPA: hypothetical protein VM345_04145 [Acidimicrobiales bacterium]|jgi:hypothetical protein|nr:hypothetical protein [Acidimicrobiales bacterium]